MLNQTSTRGVAKIDPLNIWRESSSVFQRSKPLKQFLQQLHSTILQELHNKFLTVDASTISQQSSPRESHNSPTKGSIVPKSLTESPKKKKTPKLLHQKSRSKFLKISFTKLMPPTTTVPQQPRFLQATILNCFIKKPHSGFIEIFTTNWSRPLNGCSKKNLTTSSSQ